MIIDGMMINLSAEERRTLFTLVTLRQQGIRDLLEDLQGLPEDFVKWSHSELATLARIRDKIGGKA